MAGDDKNNSIYYTHPHHALKYAITTYLDGYPSSIAIHQ